MERYIKHRSITPVRLASLKSNSNSKIFRVTPKQTIKKEKIFNGRSSDSRRSSLQPKQILNFVKSEEELEKLPDMPIISAAKVITSNQPLKSSFRKKPSNRPNINSFPKIGYSNSQTQPNSLSHTPSNSEMHNSVKKTKISIARNNIGRSISASSTPVVLKNNSFKRLDCSYTLSNPKADFTMRMSWSRRAASNSKPLLILTYTGVIGDYFFETLWSEERKHYLVPNFTKGYSKLREHFQTVLFLGLGKKQVDSIMKNLKSLSFTFDAVYRRRKQSIEYFRQDYSQIYSDFEISSKYIRTSVNVTSIQILTSINLEISEITSRNSKLVIYEQTASNNKRIAV